MTTSRPILENRAAHTVYLSDELWDSLERVHLERRLAGSAGVSKVEFLETVMAAGLRSFQHPPPAQPETTDGAAKTDVRESSPAGSPLEVVPDSSVARLAERPPPVTASSKRRPNPMERLLQASDPGHPAPIRSVADQSLVMTV